MEADFRLVFAVGAAAMLSGCNMVLTEKPMFTVADGVGAPPIRAGVWRDEKAGCNFDETLPQDKWPECAGASGGPDETPFWVEASGDPLILQLPLHLPGAKGENDAYVYAAFRPLKLDAQGRVIAMKQWAVRCGPPPPPPELPPIRKFDDSASRRQARKLSAEDQAKLEKAEADLAKLQVESRKMLVELARTQPTKQPLPGLTMDSKGGGSCTPASVQALRAAAKAGEVWAEDDAVSHWVRERGPGDKPAATASSLLDGLGGDGPGGSEAPDRPAPISAPVVPPHSEASCDADRIRYAAKIGVPCWSLGAKVDLPAAGK